MNERDRIQSLADCRSDSFEIAHSDITDGKYLGGLVSRNPSDYVLFSASRLINHTNWLGAKSNCRDDPE